VDVGVGGAMACRLIFIDGGRAFGTIVDVYCDGYEWVNH
jgi:hypothetical protein